MAFAGGRTPEAEAVFENLRRLPEEGKFVYSWCHPWPENKPAGAELKGGFSEEHGRHPVLYFTDFYFVTDARKPAEKIRASRTCLTAMVKKAWTDYRAVPVFSWHPENPYVLVATNGDWSVPNAPYRYRYATKGYPQEHRYVIREILTEKGFARDWYDARLKEIGDFLADLRDEKGVAIPAVVRLFHECEDDWQWWGAKSVSVEDYKTIFRETARRLRERLDGGKNLLFAYSPDRYWDTAVDPSSPKDLLYRYPGDDVVDVIGFDDYSIGNGKDDDVKAKQIFDAFVRRLRMTAACARARGKASGLFETGVLGAVGQKTKRDDTYDLFHRAFTSPGATLGFLNTWGGDYSRPQTPEGRACWKRFVRRDEVLTYESGFDLVNGFRGKPAEKTASDEAFTVRTWIRIPKTDDPDRVMLQRRYAFCCRGERVTGYDFVLGSQRGCPEFSYCGPDGKWRGVLPKQGGEPTLALDTWHHLAGVRTKEKSVLYLDGVCIGEAVQKEAPPRVEAPLLRRGLRVFPSHVLYRFCGDMENFAYEPRAWSAEEIAAAVKAERETLSAKSWYDWRVAPEWKDPLPLVSRREGAPETSAACPRAANCLARVVKVAGVPRFEVDGKVVDASAFIPDYGLPPEEVGKSVREFSAAGVRMFSDIWWTYGKSADWWLGEGKYDFAAFDRRLTGLLAQAPDGRMFVRLKLDPPEWWQKAHPEEMLGGCVRPTSEPWRALYVRMLRDVIGHVESSPQAARVIGYLYGAMIGCEWLSPLREKPEKDIPLTFEERANGPVESALLAAKVIKEVTRRNKLTGVFYGYDAHYFPEHARLMDIVRSPDIDFIASPTGYYCRREGEPGRFNTNFQASYRLHGKVYWNESDLVSEYAKGWRMPYHSTSERETLGRIRRTVGWALTSGHEYWWFLIFGNNSFHDEAMMEAVQEGVRLSANRPALPRKAEVAVFSPVYLSSKGPCKPWPVRDFIDHHLPTCGVPVDSYELADLANPDLPSYKAHVVVGADADVPKPAHADVKTLRVKTGYDAPDDRRLQRFFEQAGAHVWCRSRDAFAAGCGFAMIHAVADGEKTVSFPAESGGGEWRGTMRRGETKILSLQTHEELTK